MGCSSNKRHVTILVPLLRKSRHFLVNHVSIAQQQILQVATSGIGGFAQ